MKKSNRTKINNKSTKVPELSLNDFINKHKTSKVTQSLSQYMQDISSNKQSSELNDQISKVKIDKQKCNTSNNKPEKSKSNFTSNELKLISVNSCKEYRHVDETIKQ